MAVSDRKGEPGLTGARDHRERVGVDRVDRGAREHATIVCDVSPRRDEADLFRTHHQRLLRLIACDVPARPQVIEDACAYAWLELVARQPERTNMIGRLRVVARREAIRMARRDARTLGLTGEPGYRAEADPSAASTARDALALVAALPSRKRAVLGLHVAGHSYREIGARLGMTDRTVERQMVRARAQVRWADRAATSAPNAMVA